MERIIITGTGGLIGYHLAKECLTRGMLVTGIDKNTSSLINRLTVYKNFTFASINIENKDEVDRVYTQQADAIYHLASQPYVWFANANPWLDFRTNVFGTLNILERAREVGAGKIIFSSTGDVYSDTYLADENSPLIPNNFYGLGKLTSEYYVKQYSKAFSLNYTVLRLSLVYGPEFRRNVLFDIIDGLIKGNDITLHTSLDSEYDLVFIGDVIQAMMLARIKTWDGKTVNISSGTGFPVKQLINIVSRYIPVNQEMTKTLNDTLIRKVYLNQQARELGWRQSQSLEEGIRRTIEWRQKEGTDGD